MQRTSGPKSDTFSGYLIYSSDLLPETKRYFVLDKSAKVLRYYQDMPEKLQPQQAHHLGEFDMEFVSQVDDLRGSKSHLCFALHYYGTKHVLQTQSLKDMEDWITVLKGCSKINVDRSERNPNRVSMDVSYRVEVVGDHVINIPLVIPESQSTSMATQQHAVHEAKRLSSPLIHRALSPVTTEARNSRTPGVVKCGFCVKMGALVKNWKRRYFVLDSQNLTYYENETCKKVKGSISLKGMTDCRASCGSSSNKDNLFEIATSDRTFLIQADTSEEMGSWIDEIRSLLALPRLSYL